MKKIIYIAVLMILTGVFISYKEEFVLLYYKLVNMYLTSEEISVNKNKYYRDYNFLYLNNTDDFKPKNYQDVINIFYTVINSGEDSFTFYCPSEYSSCLDDVKALADNQAVLSHINNFVHPYNGFKYIETQYNNIGEVTILITKNYSSEDIELIEAKIEQISSSLNFDNISDKEKIKVVHDYIINNSKYDSARSDYNIIKYKSDLAYGPLLEGYGICGGYSDAMQLFLERFGIKNYKVSSDSHVWNAVYLNNQWYHLDLTWDDPITSDNSNILQSDFFLITTEQLLSKNVEEHDYDNSVYLELKKA